MSITTYIFLYFLGAVVSFFAFAKIFKFKQHEASLLMVMSFFYPLLWIMVILVATWFMLQEYAEKYLEKINEGKDE